MALTEACSRYLPLRYSCSVLTSSAESSFIEQIERVAAIAAFIVVKYGSLKRSAHAKNRKRCGEASINSNGARRRNAKAARMSSGAEISSSRRLERLYKLPTNCLQTAYKLPTNCRKPLANPRQTVEIYTVRSTTKRRKPPARKF